MKNKFSKCKKEQPLSEFGKHIDCLDGHTGVCKSCKRKYNKSRSIDKVKLSDFY